ncbi:AbrB/MazE/SpoVT family DNA-binding domain-containing protein [Natronoglomus mannanivorans]|uniref:SpoVT-AbrB domain-containing protein n=1 Tax=Natronoglomus mannanivorans TaxID=2979990 RepID=A0AAP2Z2W2_9EURY|nr:hypothetical protein [Halobacteria archaeon AArc-xg1-1]
MSNGVDVDPDAKEVSGVRKLRRSGDSYVISIPPEVLDMSGLEPGEHYKVAAPFEGGEITISPKESEEDTEDENDS